MVRAQSRTNAANLLGRPIADIRLLADALVVRRCNGGVGWGGSMRVMVAAPLECSDRRSAHETALTGVKVPSAGPV